MTDLHTHILPGMDDGARDVQISLCMLRMEAEQGVDTVALTPHFYRDRERAERFLKRRSAAFETLMAAIHALPEAEQASLPELFLGAEVAWMPNLSDWPELDRLCYQGSEYIMIELPFRPWSEGLFQQLYDLMNRTGLMPVIAHIDRYFRAQKRNLLDELFSLGLPVQVSADAFMRFSTRGRALKCLREGKAQLLISDCHNVDTRPPGIGDAINRIQQKLGSGMTAFLSSYSDEFKPGSQ